MLEERNIKREPEKLNRYELFMFAYKNLENYSEYFTFPFAIEDLKKMYYDSAEVIKGFEENFKEEKNFFDFREGVFKQLELIGNNSLKNLVKNAFLQIEVKNSNNNSRYGVNVLLKAICEYQNNVFSNEIRIIEPLSGIKYFKKNRPQIFLSYAYYDAGLTFALYLYFLAHGAFLYVNWMWAGTYPNSFITKRELNKELSKSVQFLFLRTSTSELRIKGGHSIRQWCSWEIGNYYTINQNEKFFIDFYDQGKPYKNDMLDTFEIMGGIYNGLIYKK